AFVIEAMRIAKAVGPAKIKRHAPHLPRDQLGKLLANGLWAAIRTDMIGPMPRYLDAARYACRPGCQHPRLEAPAVGRHADQRFDAQHHARDLVLVLGA